jgi:hypothetical protein
MRTTPHKLTLIDAIRTISRSAHAWRDRAADRYSLTLSCPTTEAMCRWTGHRDVLNSDTGRMDAHRLSGADRRRRR